MLWRLALVWHLLCLIHSDIDHYYQRQWWLYHSLYTVSRPVNGDYHSLYTASLPVNDDCFTHYVRAHFHFDLFHSVLCLCFCLSMTLLFVLFLSLSFRFPNALLFYLACSQKKGRSSPVYSRHHLMMCVLVTVLSAFLDPSFLFSPLSYMWLWHISISGWDCSWHASPCSAAWSDTGRQMWHIIKLV